MKKEDLDDLRNKDSLMKSGYAGFSHQDMSIMMSKNMADYQKGCQKLMQSKEFQSDGGALMQAYKKRINDEAQASPGAQNTMREELVSDLIVSLGAKLAGQFSNSEQYIKNPRDFAEKFRGELKSVNISIKQDINEAKQSIKQDKSPENFINSSRVILRKQVLQSVLKEMDSQLKWKAESKLEDFLNLSYQNLQYNQKNRFAQNEPVLANIVLNRSEHYYQAKLERHINEIVKSSQQFQQYHCIHHYEQQTVKLSELQEYIEQSINKIGELESTIQEKYSEQLPENLVSLATAKAYLNQAKEHIQSTINDRSEKEEKIQDVRLSVADQRVTTKDVQADRRLSFLAQQQSTSNTTISDMERYAQKARENRAGKSDRLSLLKSTVSKGDRAVKNAATTSNSEPASDHSNLYQMKK